MNSDVLIPRRMKVAVWLSPVSRAICLGTAIAVLILIQVGRSLADEDSRLASSLERVPRSRNVSVALEKVSALLADGEGVEALRLAQRILDQDSDSFTDELSSSHLKVESLLRNAPESVRRNYDSIAGTDADRAFNDAQKNLSVQSLRQVVRRYFLTAAGYSASERLIALWLDSGEYELASRLANQVLAEPAHLRRMTDRFRALAVSVKLMDARLKDANKGAPGAARLTGKASHFHEQILMHQGALFPFEREWNLFGGNASRSRIVHGSQPVPVPAWSGDFFPNQASWTVQEFLKDWEATRRDVDQPTCPASFPVVLHDQMIFRDPASLRSVDVQSGRTKWSFACHYNPMSAGSQREMALRRRVGFRSGVTGGENSLGENSLMGAISSNGQLVFVIDSTDDDSVEEYQETGLFLRPFRTRLVAVKAVGADAGRLAWVHDGQLQGAFKKPNPLERINFLGPPLPGAKELLCLTEQGDEIHLTGIEAHTGVMTWSQSLCTIERMEQFDSERHEIACLPARADGIVVCPTHTGLLVAVDQARMNLIWAAFVDDLPDSSRRQFRGNVRIPIQGYPGYAAPVMISGGRVVYLPPRSNDLHCLDLLTGKSVWTVERGDAEFIGAISDGRILVVGRTRCRSLAVEDGRELWSTKSGVPAGRGIAIGNRYTLPLEDGRLASLDMKTGQDHGTSILRSDTALGHLVADRDRVYSLSHRGLVAFPQVDHVLAKINSATPAVGQSSQILQAEVSIIQGNLDDAARRLRAALDGHLSTVDRDRARKTLKELLFEKVMESSSTTASEFGMLDQLLESPEERFRFLIAAARVQEPPGISTVEQLAARAASLPLDVTGAAVPGDPDWVISPAAWCRLQLKSEQSGEFADHFQKLHRERMLRLKAASNMAEMAGYISIFDGAPQAEPERSDLASRFAVTGAGHSAETLLLRNSQSVNRTTAATAALGLMELWESSGFVMDAADQLELLATDYADTRLTDGLTGTDHLRSLKAQRPAKRAWLRAHEPAWPVNHVAIRQVAIQPDFAEPVLSSPPSSPESIRFQPERQEIAVRGKYFRVPGRFAEFVTSGADSEDLSTLTVFDQRTRLRLGFLTIPQSNRPPMPDSLVSQGHLIPFGVPGGIVGVSTLQLGDAEPVWKHFPAELAGRKSNVMPGPTNANYSSYLWRNRLYVVDSLDGTLLWQRVISSASQTPRMQVLGDSRALAVQIPERTAEQSSERKIYYEVFEAATGRMLSTVRTGYLANQWQGYFGRHVIGFAETPEGKRLQIRDLLMETPQISEVVSESSRQPILLPSGELVYIGPGGEIKIFDIRRCRLNLSVQLDASELLPVNVCRVFFDRFRYFVNLQRHVPTLTTTHFNQAITNSHLPSVSARDDVYAFDRTTGELLWKRSIPYRTILQFPGCDVPFLVTISQVKDKVNNSLQSLTMEVIDSQSGATIGYRENLSFEQLLTAHYDGEAGRILIRGQTSDIELGFGPAEGQIQARR